MEQEAQCYRDGTYTLPYIDGYHPFGVVKEFKFNCDSCRQYLPLTNWINHNVQRTESNKDRNGSYGHYCQVSYYCASCYPVIESLAKKIHK